MARMAGMLPIRDDEGGGHAPHKGSAHRSECQLYCYLSGTGIGHHMARAPQTNVHSIKAHEVIERNPGMDFKPDLAVDGLSESILSRFIRLITFRNS